MKASLGILLMITGTEPCIAVCALLLAAIIYPVQFSKDIADGEIEITFYPVQSPGQGSPGLDNKTFFSVQFFPW